MTIRVHGANGAERLGYFQGDNALIKVDVTGVDAKVTNVLHTAADLKVLFMDSGIDTATWTNIPVESRTVVDGYGNSVEYTTEAEWDEAYYAQANYRIIIEAVQQRSVIIAVNSDDASAITMLIERAAVWDAAFPNQYGQLEGATAVEGKILEDEFVALGAAKVFRNATGVATAVTPTTSFSKSLPML